MSIVKDTSDRNIPSSLLKFYLIFKKVSFYYKIITFINENSHFLLKYFFIFLVMHIKYSCFAFLDIILTYLGKMEKKEWFRYFILNIALHEKFDEKI